MERSEELPEERHIFNSGISGRAWHVVFTFELLTAAIQPCQYLQGAIVTERFHTHIYTPPGALHSQPHHAQESLCYQKATVQTMGFTSRRRAEISLHPAFSNIFVSALRKHGGPCPCCLHSWIHGKDCLIWNLTWAMRLQGEMRERIQVGGREGGGGEGE